jgi:hypothetical protein
VPEIILQTAEIDFDKNLQVLGRGDSSRIINDGVISQNSSLAKALLEDPSCSHKNKLILGLKKAIMILLRKRQLDF